MYEYKAKCLRILDGDTIEVLLYLGFGISFTEKVRLYGIDTPETFRRKKDSEEYKAGMVAKNRVKELIKGKEITVKTIKDKKGKYGRYLAIIYIDDVNLNELLLSEGLAKETEY